ncbi:MAG TPA: mechanosensitive ion channel domain-containing protein [Opitutaceae bacterium]|nr:mechanosensitive ion channel domain-containing protein [Opitutaceae bacterium]
MMNSAYLVLAQTPPPASPKTDWAAALSGKQYIVSLAESLRDGVAHLVERISPGFAAKLDTVLFARVTGMDLIAPLVTTSLMAALIYCIKQVLRRHAHPPEKNETDVKWRPLILHAMARPLYLLLWTYGLFFAIAPILLRLGAEGQPHPLQVVVDKLVNIGVFIALLWLFVEFTRLVEHGVTRWTRRTRSSIDDLLATLIIRTARIILPVLAIIMALPLVGLPPRYEAFLSTAGSLLLVCSIGWVLSHGVLLVEKNILENFDVKVANNLRARSVHTQVQVMRKTLLFVIAIFTIASALMVFGPVRQLGTSILASAGVLGIIVGFAAQRTISNLFAGMQIALTQPIRLNDVVIVENEWGRIEEISLTYVVVRIWDLRRLVVPIQYFIDNPFQNWTRASANLLGTVFFYCDYTIPVGEVRAELLRIVKKLPEWDGSAVGLQVTDVTEHTIQLRALASAADASKAFDLRCAIREQLLDFLQTNYPESLPRTRVDFERSEKAVLSQGA